MMYQNESTEGGSEGWMNMKSGNKKETRMKHENSIFFEIQKNLLPPLSDDIKSEKKKEKKDKKGGKLWDWVCSRFCLFLSFSRGSLEGYS